jgi:recombination protein RecA
MFSMSALPAISLDATTLARLGVLQGTEAMLPSRSVLGLDWPELEQALPDRGLPRGVIELAAMPRMTSSVRHGHSFDSMRGGTTTIAIAAARAAHAADDRAWCAWLAPEGAPSLYAPALAQAGVDLDRLLVVRTPAPALSRTVVKAASSGAFALVVVDIPRGTIQNGNEGAVVTRKLALAAEEYGTTSLLLTSALQPRTVPWPVAMRLEVERRPDALAIRVAKDRRGAASSHHVVRLAS